MSLETTYDLTLVTHETFRSIFEKCSKEQASSQPVSLEEAEEKHLRTLGNFQVRSPLLLSSIESEIYF